MPPHPAEFSPFAASIGAVAFWMFVAIIASVSVLSTVFRHRETQKTIRQAIERGQSLDPQTLERLLSADRPPAPTKAGLGIGGIVLVCLGVGFALMGWFASQTKPDALYPGLGVGSLIGMLGVALLLASLFVRSRNGAGRE